jgi:hypothetical protein
MRVSQLVRVLVGVVLMSGLGCEQVVRSFTATLDGYHIVPPVTTTATGSAKLELNVANTEVACTVDVVGIANATSAFLHYAPAGVNGEVIADFYLGPPKPGSYTGRLTTGSLRTADLKGPLAGSSMDAFINSVRAGSTYVVVCTDSFPDGEIRGQVR